MIYWCDFDHSQSGSGSAPGITYFESLGVLPEWLYHFCGSILPVPFFKPCGSTPSRIIPLLWEHSHKSGIAFPGALPEQLFCHSGSKICGSTPRVLIPVCRNAPRVLIPVSGSTPRVFIAVSGSTPRVLIPKLYIIKILLPTSIIWERTELTKNHLTSLSIWWEM